MLALACAMAIGAQTSVPAFLVEVRRIVMMGDSITQLGAQPKGYVTLVAQTLRASFPGQPIEVLNAGISGEKAPDMLARFQHDVIAKHPQVVTLSVGVNDVWHDFRTPAWTARVPEGNSGRGVRLQDYISGVDQMITMAQRADIRIILLSPSLVYEDLDCAENRRLSEYVRAEEALARRRNVPFVNLNAAFKKVIGAFQREAGRRQLLLTTDGVHLNDAGNALFAEQVLRALGVKTAREIGP